MRVLAGETVVGKNVPGAWGDCDAEVRIPTKWPNGLALGGRLERASVVGRGAEWGAVECADCVRTVSPKAAKPGGDTPERRRRGGEKSLNRAKFAT
jgi:hypothetical protein